LRQDTIFTKIKPADRPCLKTPHQQKISGDIENHKVWIKSLLVDYYDPMYDFQLSIKQDRVVSGGPPEEVLIYLKDSHQID